jgi:uncharacterized protein (TIGR02145 family)
MKNLVKVFSLLCLLTVLWACKKEPDSDTVYDNGKTIIPNLTKVLSDDEFNTSLINIDSTDYTLTFKNSSSTSNINKGDIISSSVGEGLLRKVISVTKEQGQIILKTEQASLSEAIRKADINFELNSGTMSGLFQEPKIKYIHDGIKLNNNAKGNSSIKDLLNNITINLTIDGDENLQTLNDQISVRGTLSIDQGCTGDINIDNFTLQKLSLAYTFAEQLNLSAIYTANLINLKKEIPFLKVTSKVPSLITVGPLFILVTPVLTLYAGVDFTANSKITTSVNQNFNFTTGITYESKKWIPYANVDKSFTFIPPTLTLGASAKVYVRPELSLLIDGCVAPTISSPIYTQLSASATDNPWWNLKAGIQGIIGIQMKIFSLIVMDISTSLFDVSFPITQAPGGIPMIPTVSTGNPSTITQTSATIGGNVTADGNATVTERGVFWGTLQNPELAGTKLQIGNGTGTFSTNLTELNPNTPYYVKAYAINSRGTAYGNQVSFTTSTIALVLPTLTTVAASSITSTTAISGGNISGDGGASVTARGICWSTIANPTISLSTKTSDGTGTGTFTSSITGLSANTIYYVRAYATNSIGTAYGTQVSFTTSPLAPIAPTLSTTAASSITTTAASSGGNITSDGGASVTARGICWSTSANPTTALTTKTSDGTGSGSFTSNLTGLTANTTYYVRAYATNSIGTAYGTQVSFTTGAAVLVIPTLTTTAASLITQTTATSGGNITSDGGASVTARGICWSTLANPTTALSTKTSDGTGTGSFTSSLTGLIANTTYYVRAYATNSIGTAYGTQVSFNTSPLAPVLPTLSTTAASSISTTTASSGGNITSDGGASITARGVCWSTSTNPTTALSTKTSDGTGTGIFTSSLTSLTANTTYYVRSYATNSIGTAYGNQVSFTTSSGVQPGTVTDIEGNIYNAVTIGTQTWMVENLKTTKYNDGTAIPNVTNEAAWAALTTPAYCWYNNDATYKATYGALYNWYTVNSTRSGGKNVCPTNWHVSSDAEWTALTTFLGGIDVAGGKLKEIGTTHWSTPNTGATNETGFTALPGSLRDNLGKFMPYIGLYGSWYTSTEDNTGTGVDAFARSMMYTLVNVTLNGGNMGYGMSVRCLKDN